MDNSDSWNRLARRSLRPRFDMLLGYEDMDFGEEELKVEIPCPFCGEELDTLELCFHIDDEHPVEAKNGICPICVARVGADLVGHITIQHANFYKMQKKRRSGRKPSNPFGSLLRANFKDHHLFNTSSSSRSFAAEPDPLISSFVASVAMAEDEREEEELEEEEERESLECGSVEERIVESVNQQPSVPKEDLEERTQRTNFVQGLVLSTLFDDFTL